MVSTLSFLSFVAASGWLAILLLPWRPWSTREVLEAEAAAHPSGFSDLTVLIPARNEAAQIGTTLLALVAQGGSPKVIVVDDHSDDDTAERASSVTALSLEVIRSDPLPEGWSGKLWALQQGLAQVTTRHTLLLDADISLEPGMLSSLLRMRERQGAGFVSVMASLRMQSFWEKLLMPAFVHFFKMLYPFHLANSGNLRFSAGAGGCILVETEVLRAIGGFSSIRNELIDDCALAATVKKAGHRIWVGLSRGVVSHRRYEQLEPIWDMVARTAFTQLRYSPVYLALCTALMLILYWVPVIAILAPAPPQLPALLACSVMFFTYLPILRFYGLGAAWGLAQPFVAALYLAMTWSSALRYWRGERSRWKGRVYR